MLTDYNQHWLCQQILLKLLGIKFNINSFSASRVAACGPDRHSENIYNFFATLDCERAIHIPRTCWIL
jgi:hypothetical protein